MTEQTIDVDPSKRNTIGRPACQRESSARRTCAACGAAFFAKASVIRKGGGKYCSRGCFAAVRRLPAPDGGVGQNGVLTERDRTRRHAARLVAAGLCVYCRSPHDRGTRRCATCTAQAVQRNQRTKIGVRASGRCEGCRRPWLGETKRCPGCKALFRAKWERRTKSDHCVRCGEVKDGPHKACAACREQMRSQTNARRAALVADGRCVQCGVPRSGPSLYCDQHILKTAARRWLGHASKWRDLEALFRRQRALCAYTGEPLVLGGNASLDHITPRSRGGDDAIGNVQWVTWTANRVKTDMTHGEFVALCMAVVERWAPTSESCTPEATASSNWHPSTGWRRRP